MPMRLEGSCRCGAVSFAFDSQTPYPYQRGYCSVCRKSAGGGGYAINIMGDAATLKVQGRRAIRVWHATIDGEEGSAARAFLPPWRHPLMGLGPELAGTDPPVRLGDRHAIAAAAGQCPPAIARQ